MPGISWCLCLQFQVPYVKVIEIGIVHPSVKLEISILQCQLPVWTGAR